MGCPTIRPVRHAARGEVGFRPLAGVPWRKRCWLVTPRPTLIDRDAATHSRYGETMLRKRLAALLCLAVLGLSLGGCSKCGWLWDEGGRTCHSGTPR